jgi:hypothetical protein
MKYYYYIIFLQRTSKCRSYENAPGGLVDEGMNTHIAERK